MRKILVIGTLLTLSALIYWYYVDHTPNALAFILINLAVLIAIIKK